ncbi:MAG: NAD(P)/FAD-dependent oxidoreductase [Archaeoglobus sp.]|nr:NAD(P)/FAD-dependent oxidoreductase [Archaeoglobus sp.]
MKIQIYGAGMAGSFLYMLLKQEFGNVGMKDTRKNPDCRCAWGIAYRQAKELYKRIGIKIDDYILIKPKYAITNGLKLKNKNIAIFDRKKLLEDLWDEIEFKELDGGLKIDATGFKRAFLPKIENDRIYPTIQSIEEHDVDENIYVHARKTGYAWAFPLGDKRWHIGAGDLSDERARELIEVLRQKYGFDLKESGSVCSCKSKIRLLPPSACRPFIVNDTYGVGEVIGCVSGAGEGNVPSLRSAEILYECIVEDKLNEYESRILKEFDWIEEEHEFVNAVQSGKKLKALLKLPRVVAIESKRSVEQSVGDLFRLLRGLK